VHVTKDGKKIPVEVNNHLIEYNGQVVCLAVSRDMTERKNTEEELRLSNIYNRSLIEVSLDPLVTIGPDGKINDVNNSTELATGYSREELIGTDFSDYFTEPQKAREGYKKVFREGLVRDYPLEIQNRNGDITPVLYNASVYTDEHGKVMGVFAAARDIKDLKKAENNIKESLREKEILLREIHHRVKNNLQIVSSLLSLQTEFVDGEESLDVLMESRGRIQTMALIHEELYRSSSLKEIRFKEFVNSLISNLFYSYGISGNIGRIVEVEDLNIGIDTAIPCGLVINELVTNSLKYAFPESFIREPVNGTFTSPQGKGTIKIELKKFNDKFNLIISDDGMGMPENFEMANAETLGLKMVCNLVEQLDGTMKVDLTNGTRFEIIFKELEYKERI
jgi:PAS domain S-box-containing protein